MKNIFNFIQKRWLFTTLSLGMKKKQWLEERNKKQNAKKIDYLSYILKQNDIQSLKIFLSTLSPTEELAKRLRLEETIDSLDPEERLSPLPALSWARSAEAVELLVQFKIAKTQEAYSGIFSYFLEKRNFEVIKAFIISGVENTLPKKLKFFVEILKAQKTMENSKELDDCFDVFMCLVNNTPGFYQPKEKNDNPLTLISQNPYKDSVRYAQFLLDNEENLNGPVASQYIPIQWAVLQEDQELFGFLVDRYKANNADLEVFKERLGHLVSYYDASPALIKIDKVQRETEIKKEQEKLIRAVPLTEETESQLVLGVPILPAVKEKTVLKI